MNASMFYCNAGLFYDKCTLHSSITSYKVISHIIFQTSYHLTIPSYPLLLLYMFFFPFSLEPSSPPPPSFNPQFLTNPSFEPLSSQHPFLSPLPSYEPIFPPLLSGLVSDRAASDHRGESGHAQRQDFQAARPSLEDAERGSEAALRRRGRTTQTLASQRVPKLQVQTQEEAKGKGRWKDDRRWRGR